MIPTAACGNQSANATFPSSASPHSGSEKLQVLKQTRCRRRKHPRKPATPRQLAGFSGLQALAGGFGDCPVREGCADPAACALFRHRERGRANCRTSPWRACRGCRTPPGSVGRLRGYNGEVGSAGGLGSRCASRGAAHSLDLTGRETKRAGGSAWCMSGCAGPPFHLITFHGHPLPGVQPFVVRATGRCRPSVRGGGSAAILPLWRSSFNKESRALRWPSCMPHRLRTRSLASGSAGGRLLDGTGETRDDSACREGVGG